MYLYKKKSSKLIYLKVYKLEPNLNTLLRSLADYLIQVSTCRVIKNLFSFNSPNKSFNIPKANEQFNILRPLFIQKSVSSQCLHRKMMLSKLSSTGC